MQISIITPFHNTPARLFRKTAEAVSAVCFPQKQMEWIIVFHNCQETYVKEAKEILNDLALSPGMFFLEDRFSTPSAPRNFGLEHAHGKYLYFLDSDDLVSPCFFSDALTEAEKEGTELIVAGAQSEIDGGNLLPLPMSVLLSSAGGIYRINNSEYLETDGEKGIQRRNRQILGRLLYGAPVFLSTKLIRRDLVERNNIRFSCDAALIEDILFEAELYARAEKISVMTGTKAYTYIQSEDSQLQKLVRKSGFTPDVLLGPVNRILDICDREDIDSNLFLWSIFEMLGAMVLKGELAPEILEEMKNRTAPLVKRLKPVGYTGPEGIRKTEAMTAVAGVFIGRPLYELDSLRESLEDLIEKSRDYEGCAIRMEGGNLSYGRLHRISDRIAEKLTATVNDGRNPVGICMQKGLLQYAAVMAVLKTGLPMVILSPDAPEERELYILKETGTCAILTDENSACEKKDLQIPEVCCSLKDEAETVFKSRKKRPEETALIEFTSGSEGMPKGVCFTRRNLLSLLYPFSSNYQVADSYRNADVVIIHMGIDFLFGLLSSLEAVLNKKELCVCKDPGEIGLPFVRDVLTDSEKRPGLIAVPSTAAQWFNDPELEDLFCCCTGLRYGGEGVREDQLRAAGKRLTKGAVIYSGYATTETGPAAYRRVTPEHISCGFPLSDVTISILDEDLNCVPTGVRGRICVSGYRVSGGYLNREDESSFVPGRNGINHFISGDEGYLTDDGELYVTGRIDRMIKVHGIRVEPSEIEAGMLACPGIGDAHVLRLPHNGRDAVCGFFTSEKGIPEAELRAFLASHLPYYMIPEFLIRVDRFDLTERGKLDTRSLRLPENTTYAEELQEESCTAEQETVLRAFRKACGTPELGLSDNFFFCGGDSLKALKIVSALNGAGYRVRVKDVFVYPTPELLAGILEKEACRVSATDGKREKAEAVPDGDAGPVQYRFEAGATAKGYFEMPEDFREAYRYCLRIQFTTLKTVDEAYLSERIPAMVKKHPALRTVFGKEDGKVFGTVYREGRSVYYCKDISHLPENARQNFIRGFWHFMDENNENFSVASLKTEEQKYEVLVRINHMTADALGSNILLSELMAKDCSDIKGTDDGFIAGQEDLKQKKAEKTAAFEFFRSYLKGAAPARVARSFGILQTAGQVGCRKIRLGTREYKMLQDSCREKGILFDLYVQYLYGRALAETLGPDNVIFLCIFSGRTEKNMNAVGNFITLLPVCSRKGESAFEFQRKYLELEEYYYTDADEIGRELHMPFRALGCADGINSNLLEDALDPKEVPVSFQVVWEDLKGIRMYPEDGSAVIEMSYYLDPETDRIYAGVEEKLRHMLQAGEGL